MKLLKKCFAFMLVLVMSVSAVACGKEVDELNKTANELKLETEKSVSVWYCDDKYTNYLKTVAESFHNANNKVTINLNLVSSVNYLTNIYDESVRNDNAADIFLMNADELEKVCMMGLVAENNTYASNYTAENYCDTAIQSATYNGKLYGYPISFNVAFMAYNTKFASAVSSFEELAQFNESFEVTEENQVLKNIVAWDVSDMFLNFGFSAGSIQIGGDVGEDSSVAQADVEKLKSAMSEYVHIRDYYGISKADTTEELCNETFRDGHMAYTIMSMKYLKSVMDSSISFGICEIPELAEGLKANSMSETTLAVVNQYADDLELAKAVANAISYDYAPKVEEAIGMLSARNIAYSGDNAEMYTKLYDIYKNSTMKAQFMGSASMYARYEILINQVWDGTEVETAVDTFLTGLKPRNEQ